MTNLATLCPGDHNAKTHGGWVHVLDPETGALTQTNPLGRTYTTGPSPPVAPTGRSGDPPRPGPVPIEFDDEYFFPTGEPPPEPADEQTAPPDPAAEVDRWLEVAASGRPTIPTGPGDESVDRLVHAQPATDTFCSCSTER